MAKRLVITADDFGASEEADRKIMKCRREGAVTDIGLLAVGASFEHAARLAGENNIKNLGIHLAMTGPFNGVLCGKLHKGYIAFLASYFMGLINKDKIYAEFKAQISRIKEKGFTITHLDSHQHIHMIPGILKIVVKLIKEEGIRCVRFPRERINIFRNLPDIPALIRHFLLFFMCALSENIIKESGVGHNDYFIGHAFALRLKKKDLISAISGIKDGLTELGCHPGNSGQEKALLCDKSFIDGIKKQNIELVSY